MCDNRAIMIHAIQHCMTEWSFASGKAYPSPFHDVTLDVVVTDADGEERTIPAFWAGEQAWTVRYAALTEGEHHYRTICSDDSNPDLHGRKGKLVVSPYRGRNPLLVHGPLEVSGNA